MSSQDGCMAAIPAAATRLPVARLLVLASGAFVTILTEALPAGLLADIGAGLQVSEALAGQLVSVYALGSLLTAIPLARATAHWPRRRLLLLALAGFTVVNAITAVTTSYALALVVRFLAGVSAGLLWALLAGYASRMAPPALQGRAIAVATVGTPLALALGIPAGTVLGQAVGWRWTFGLMSLLSAAVLLWGRLALPPMPGLPGARGFGIGQVFRLPGVRPVLAAMFAFVLAHNLLYTYIVPFLDDGLGVPVDSALLAFGVASLAGIGVAGAGVDRHLRALVLGGTVAFAAAALALAWNGRPVAVTYAACIVWGIAFGGAATLYQTALLRAAGEAGDIAQSMTVTSWNLAIAGGVLLGGVALAAWGAASLPWTLLLLLMASLAIAAGARRYGFPPDRPGSDASAPGEQPKVV